MSKQRHTKLVRALIADAVAMARPLGVSVSLRNGGRHQHIRLEYGEAYRIVPIGTGDAPEHVRDNAGKHIRRLLIEITTKSGWHRVRSAR
jgi:hypothetical protein